MDRTHGTVSGKSAGRHHKGSMQESSSRSGTAKKVGQETRRAGPRTGDRKRDREQSVQKTKTRAASYLSEKSNIKIDKALPHKNRTGSNSKPNPIIQAWEQYWFGYRIHYALLVFFRFTFFVAFAFDCWTHIHRAAKYSFCSEFNISHLALPIEIWLRESATVIISSSLWAAAESVALDLRTLVLAALESNRDSNLIHQIGGLTFLPEPIQLASLANSISFFPPSPNLLVLCWTLMTLLALRIAIGQFRRWELFLLTVLQGYHYYSSQLNLYQHEHLLSIILFIWCFVDWSSVEQQSKQYSQSRWYSTVNCWPIRLLLVQLSVVYLWTAVAKMNPIWTGPEFLPSLFSPRFNALLDAHIYPSLATSTLLHGLSPGHIWQFAAIATIGFELLLSVLILVGPGPRLNRLLFLFGIMLHISMEASGLQIGHFSYFMIISYLLLLPYELQFAIQCAIQVIDSFVKKLDSIFCGILPRILCHPLDFFCTIVLLIGGHYLVWSNLRFEAAMKFSILLAFDIVLLVPRIMCGADYYTARLQSSKNHRSQFPRLFRSGLVFLLCCSTLVAFETRTQQCVQMHQTASQDALRMGNLALAITHLEKASAAASPPSVDIMADLAILHEGLAGGREGSHDEAAKGYYTQVLELDSDNVKARVGFLWRMDRNLTLMAQRLHPSEPLSAAVKKERKALCAEVKAIRSLADVIATRECSYFEVVECESIRGFARNYVLQRVLPQLDYRWECSPV